jgi:predicted O-linked N-acetylglucosamine transferase (SPINDLY family)
MVNITQALRIAGQHRAAGRLDLAELVYRQIVAAEPEHVVAWNDLGNVLQGLGKRDEALDCYRRVLQLDPAYTPAYNNRAIVLRSLGQLDEAVQCYRQALELKPRDAQVLNNLGNALRDQGQLDAAIASFRQALELDPSTAVFHNNLGIALGELGESDQALACSRRALELDPRCAAAHLNLGKVLRALGRADEAIASCALALAIKPDFVDAHLAMARALDRVSRLDEALASARRAVELAPSDPDAHNTLGNLLHRLPRLDETLACYRRALSIDPRLTLVASNELCVLRYDPRTTPASLHAALADFDRRHGVPLRPTWRKHENLPQPERPLRLGFLAPRFARIPLGAFLIRALEHLEPNKFAAVCYAGAGPADPVAARFQARAAWRGVAGLDDPQLVEQIRADRIDILFDLAGHAPRNRLLALARKPAPVQITWIDSVGSTGLTAIDYVLADRYTIPEAAERYCAERVLRMPDGYVCFEPPDEAPAVGPLPALDAGRVTFGSFNNPAKLNPQVIEVWCRILQQVPRSRLVLKYSGFDGAACRREFGALFSRFGVERERIQMLGDSSYAECLAQYQSLDVALDPFPHGGGLTTCDALWMGVPVVTWPGALFAGRQTLSHLSTVGLTETVARDATDYVQLAAALARDLPRLAAIRAGLRAQMAASPLCDGPRFAGNLATLLRDTWRRWCVEQA